MPSKRQRCRARLEPLRRSRGKLESFLTTHSGLPGPRADLELAAAFADMFEEGALEPAEEAMLTEWLAMSLDEAPVNTKREFLPFCAAQARGILYLGETKTGRDEIFEALRAASRSPRWRTREGACFAFQRIGERDFAELRRMFEWWIERANMLDERAILVSLAHPPMLGGEDEVEFCLQVADRVLAELEKLPASGRATEEYRVLKKGLEFTLSVFVAAAPEPGFRFLSRWASSENVETKKIIAGNIRKSRLAKKHPERCEEIGETLASAF